MLSKAEIQKGNSSVSRGGSRIFSILEGGGGGGGGGGVRIFKNISKVLPTFFRSTKLTFRALPKPYKDSILAKTSAPQANFWKF